MNVCYSDDQVTLYHGDCVEVMAGMDAASVDAVVTDPPYGLEFMGKEWDSFAPARTQYYGERADTSKNIGNDTSKPSSRHRVSYAMSRPTFRRCIVCGKREFSGSPCRCEAPSWSYEQPEGTPTRMAAYEQWCQRWASECLRVLKPGGHMLAFGGSRTWHRLACAIEDAGFEIRDSIAWLYGSGFPKSLDVGKAIDKAAGHLGDVVGTETVDAGMQGGRMHTGRPRNLVTREVRELSDAAKQWQGWGTALKPAHEPIVVARKPLAGTVDTNVLKHGTGALNIDACRVDSEPRRIENYASTGPQGCMSHGHGGGEGHAGRERTARIETAGRWPTNVVLDEAAADELDRQSGYSASRVGKPRGAAAGDGWGMTHTGSEYDDSGGASRFFPTFRYEAKAPSAERPTVNGIAHPTVKPLALMRWLIRLVTPPNGVVLDPFAGSGTTAEAAIHEHKRAIVIERDPDYLPLIVARLTKPMEIGFDFGEGA